MKSLNFNEKQCVLIKTNEEFDSIFKFLRGRNNLQDYLKDRGYPEFPIYLEHAGNIGIGYRHTPFCTWTGEPLKIITLLDALS